MSAPADSDPVSPEPSTGEPATPERLRNVHHQAESGQFAEALAAIDKLSPTLDTAAYFHQLRGTILQRLDRHADAETEYTQALQIGSEYDIYAYTNRGETRIHLKKLPQAVQDLQKAVELDPQGKNPSAHRARAVLISIKEMTRQAEQLKRTE
jgi:Flp pilus assembly protein TadD